MFLKIMAEPLVANNDGVNVKPELMEKEKLASKIIDSAMISESYR